MEHKTVSAFLKAVDEDQGIVECIFAIFGNVDEGKDIVHPGSFKKTISERGPKVRVLDQHNTDSITRSLGKPLQIQEIGEKALPMELKAAYPEANGGVWAQIQFFINTPEGQGAFIRLKEGGIDEWSFGYDAVDVDFSNHETAEGKKVRVRNIRQLKLYEISPVLWGMNPATATVGAKDQLARRNDQLAMEEATSTSSAAGDSGETGVEDKAVTSFQDLDLASRERAWDGDAAEGRVRAWAGGEDDMDWAKYRTAFLWYDSDDPEMFGSYKLGYADVIDGELTAVPRGIFAAAGALQGSRGGVDIPEADAERAKRHLDRYYAKMRGEFDDEDLIAPWNKAASEATEAKTESPPDVASGIAEGLDMDQVARLIQDSLVKYGLIEPPAEPEPEADKGQEAKGGGYGNYLGDVLQGNIHYVFTCLCDKWYIQGLMDREERLLLSSLIGDALDILHQGMPGELSMRELEYGPLMADYGYGMYSFDPNMDSKAGRVLSARNAQKIQAALAQLHEVLIEAGFLAEGDETAAHHDEEDEEKQRLLLLELEREEMEMLQMEE